MSAVSAQPSSENVTDGSKPEKRSTPRALSDYQQSLVLGREIAEKYLSVLLRSGQDMHARLASYCNDGVLHEVVVSEYPDHLERLIEAGVDPHRKGMDNRTALHLAAKYGKTQACAILLGAGLDPDEPDKIGLTPRRLARTYGQAEVLALFAARDAGRVIACAARASIPTP